MASVNTVVEDQEHEHDSAYYDELANQLQESANAAPTTVEESAGYVSPYPGPPTPKHEKIGGFEFFTKVLKSPKFVVAPMVRAISSKFCS